VKGESGSVLIVLIVEPVLVDCANRMDRDAFSTLIEPAVNRVIQSGRLYEHGIPMFQSPPLLAELASYLIKFFQSPEQPFTFPLCC
jgi:hypothetical protein